MILAIESSCDDTCVAVMNINDYKLMHYEKITQESEHAKYGGVVPELAARLHCKVLPDIINRAKDYFSDIKAVAVTTQPGLSVSLLPGIVAASSLCISLNIPILPINHLIGHIYSLFLDKVAIYPLGILLVSGGHTMIIDIDSNGKISIVGQSSDDSFGESFDKVAKMLGLDYPGGPIIENLAKNADNDNLYNFTLALKGTKRIEYSFSGLKNQVRLASMQNLNDKQKANIAANFQKTACEHIVDRLNLAFMEKRWKTFGVVGGASANLKLRTLLENLCTKYECKILFAPLKYCSDNAAMIARAGVSFFKAGKFQHNLCVKMQSKSNINDMFIYK